MVGTARSIEITKVSYHAWQLKSRVPMLPLVRCATISRQLGQGRQRSGGSPLFMINHRSSSESFQISTLKSLPFLQGNYVDGFPKLYSTYCRRDKRPFDQNGVLQA